MKELIVESNQSAAQNVTSHLSNVLKQHKRTGTGEKSFTCSACDKTFTPSNAGGSPQAGPPQYFGLEDW